MLVGIEALDLARQLGGVPGWVEPLDAVDPLEPFFVAFQESVSRFGATTPSVNTACGESGC